MNRTRPPSIVSALRILALIISVLIVEFLVLEGALRAYGGSEASPAFQSLFMQDARVGHRLRPLARARYTTPEFSTDIAINAQGVRDDAPIGPKPPGERRIVVLGDSLVLAVQVEQSQTFCRLLEARLNRAAQPAAGAAHEHWRVINAGVQGYGPVDDWLFYKNVASAFQPDLVLVVLFMGNDAVEARDHASWLDAGDAPAADAQASAASRARKIVRASMVLQLAKVRVDQLAAHFKSAAPERPLTTYLSDPPADVALGLEATRRSVALIAARAAADQATVAVALMPARFETDDADFEHLAAAVTESGGTLVRDAAEPRFTRALAPLGLPTLDLLPVLLAQPERAGLFFQRTVHLTPRGHEVVAGALYDFLTSRRLTR